MKHFFTKFSLGFLTLSAAVLALVFIQQQVMAAWEAPSVSPGDQSGVNTPLIANEAGDVDLETNDIINVGNLETETLTANTSLSVLGVLDATSLETDSFNVPHSVGSTGLVDISAIDSSINLTAANAASGASVTKAGLFSSGISASGGTSYGIYADTDASSGSFANYAIAGVSNNVGGTAIYGLGNSGWAGYFSGPVGIAGSLAVGNNTTASGAYALALGRDADVSGDYAFGFGAITVSTANSFGINLDATSPQTFAQANSMTIMGGNVGINTLAPGYKLHLVGSYYQNGMMQVRPTTVLAASENIIYGNLPSGSSASSNVILLQNNAVDRFKVTALGAGTFAGTLSATQGIFSSGLLVSGSVATINSGATVGGTLGMKSGGSISFNGSAGSYFDFNDDSGALAPSCSAATSGVVYNFKVNNILCYCDGTAWFSTVVGKAASLCSSK